MSVLISGMEMPKDCQSCRFCFGYICLALKGGDGDCPLVPVPPHGRLIDADALMLIIRDYIMEYDGDLDDNGYHNGKWCAMKEAETAINNAPTIIEAEPPKEKK